MEDTQAITLPATRSRGRPKSVPYSGRLTKSVRDAFEHAFVQLQSGNNALPKWAYKNPSAFYQLAARLIPTEMNLAVKGALSDRLLAARKRIGK